MRIIANMIWNCRDLESNGLDGLNFGMSVQNCILPGSLVKQRTRAE